MSNLFRVKVIESNSKYREFLEMGCIKKEQVLEEEEEESIEPEFPQMKDDSLVYDDQMSDDDMQVEFLNEFLNAVDEKKAAEGVRVVKVVRSQQNNKIVKQESSLLLTHIERQQVKLSELKKKIETNARPNTVVLQELEQEPEPPLTPVCFICTEPASKKRLLSPFKATLNRIVSVRNCKDPEFLCEKCAKKLEDAKMFFARLDNAKKPAANKDFCQFCSITVAQWSKTAQNALKIFASLHKTGYNSKIKEDAKACAQCVQLLNRIRNVRNCYMAKENYFEKKRNNQKSTSKTNNSKKRKLKSKIMEVEGYDGFEASDSDVSVHSAVPTPSPRRRAKKRLRICATPKYVQPDPDESLPEDYQCHMSDFEEVESDTDVPPVPFRSPLNVPFKHNYINCPECALKFVNSYEMEVHYEIVHNTFDELCNLCDKGFKDVKTVKDHKFAVHTADFSAFNFRKLCDICGLAKRKFDNHYVIHFDVRAFKCRLCSCDYKTKAQLEDHIRTVHMGEKRHKCAYCDKRFSYAADKARHEIGVHTKKFKHICQFCGKCYLKKNFLTAHQKAQHTEMYLEMTMTSATETEVH